MPQIIKAMFTAGNQIEHLESRRVKDLAVKFAWLDAMSSYFAEIRAGSNIINKIHTMSGPSLLDCKFLAGGNTT